MSYFPCSIVLLPVLGGRSRFAIRSRQIIRKMPIGSAPLIAWTLPVAEMQIVAR